MGKSKRLKRKAAEKVVSQQDSVKFQEEVTKFRKETKKLQDKSSKTNVGSTKLQNSTYTENPEVENLLDPHKGPCEVCSKLSSKKCTGCKSAYYCSKKHQKEDWPLHKSSCRSFSTPSEKFESIECTESTLKFNLSGPPGGIIPKEQRYMVSRRILEAGVLLLKETPILVVSNNESLCVQHPVKEKLCIGCMQHFKGIQRADSRIFIFSACASCKLPLCKSCYKGNAVEKHPKLECNAIREATKKLGTAKCSFESEDIFKDLAVLRALLLEKTNSSHWKAFRSLKQNVRFTQSLRNTPEVVKAWVTAKTPISEYYIAHMHPNPAKLFLRLEDFKRIIALFSVGSANNPRTRVLYELLSWMPQSCSPNAARVCNASDNHEITVKVVKLIDCNEVISLNYVEDYEGGKSAAAIKLFSQTALICECVECRNFVTNSAIETSVGVRCPFLKCNGIISPMARRLDPGKKDLDLNVYSKLRPWICDRCNQKRNYSAIEQHVKDTIYKLMERMDELKKKKPTPLMIRKLQMELRNTLHQNHWLQQKFDEQVLDLLNSHVGYGTEILVHVHAHKPAFLEFIKLKINIYRGTTDGNGNATKGFLKILSSEKGPYAEVTGMYLFDAFYAYFIDFIEDFKRHYIETTSKENRDLKEYSLLELNFNESMKQSASETLLCDFRAIIDVLENVVLSFALSENPKCQENSGIAKRTLKCMKEVYEKCINGVGKPFERYLNDFLAEYCKSDAKYKACVLEDNKNKVKRLTIDDSADLTLIFDDIQWGQNDETNEDVDSGSDSSAIYDPWSSYFDEPTFSSDYSFDFSDEDYDSDFRLFSDVLLGMGRPNPFDFL